MRKLNPSIPVRKMKDSNSENRRRIARREIQQSVTVTDLIRNVEIGRLANLHHEGFMIIGGHEVRENCLYQLAFDLSDEAGQVQRVMLGAECLWTSETGSDEQCWAGFHIIDIADADLKIISSLNLDV